MYYRERRYPCRYPVTLASFGEEVMAVLHNISYHGAYALPENRPCRGEVVTFNINNLPINALVARIGPGPGVGLRFSRPLSKGQLHAIRESAQNGRGRGSLRELT